jgi:hypothetical protein
LAFILLRLFWYALDGSQVKNPPARLASLLEAGRPIPKQPLFICIFVLLFDYTIAFKTAQEGKFEGYCG